MRICWNLIKVSTLSYTVEKKKPRLQTGVVTVLGSIQGYYEKTDPDRLIKRCPHRLIYYINGNANTQSEWM